MENLVLGQRYKILEKVGGGGMAVVYKAKCQLLNRYVAVKVLRDEFIDDAEVIKKFRRESQSAASLSHPNIVNVYDVGEDDLDGKPIYYIVMEFIQGKTLKKIIKEKNGLSVKETLDYSIQIAEALKHAHDNHIIHRDIKPHNIMVTQDGRIKVTDFGIARAATSSTLTNTSNVIGSVHYFSPEQARGGYTDDKSDIYSLGIVMYEMLTGRYPYEGDSPVTVALKHIREDMKSVREIKPDIPEGLDNIILKCTQKSPDDRYENVDSLLKDLKAIEKNENHVVDLNEDLLEDSATRVIPIVKSDDIMADASEMESTAEMDIKDEIEDIEDGKKTEEPKKKKKKKSGTGKVIFMAILLAFITTSILGFGYIKLKDAFASEEVEVPVLVGLSEDEAENKLADLGLKMKVIDRVYSKDFEEGQVMSQDIKEGETVKEGYTIDVEVSKGLNHVKVPNLINRNVKDLEEILAEYGLKGQIEYKYSSDFDEGLIMSQSPDPYSEVEEGSQVRVVVSKGKENTLVEMPNLIGLKENDAKNAIVARGLVLGGDRSEKHSEEYPKGTVIWQSIDGGRQVEKNTTISITISKGPEEKVEEKEKEEAKETNKEVPFNLNLSIPDLDDDVDIAIVRYQNESKDTVYTGTIPSDQKSVVISLKGTKNSYYEVYFNGDYHDTISHPDG